MAKLTIRQFLLAAAVGALFATLQGDPPVPGLAKLAALTCPMYKSSRG